MRRVALLLLFHTLLCAGAARAEPTRLALHIAGIPFEDVRIEHAAWPAMKEKMPFGQIPVRRTRALCACRGHAVCSCEKNGQRRAAAFARGSVCSMLAPRELRTDQGP
jgi:hypothetical protein